MGLIYVIDFAYIRVFASHGPLDHLHTCSYVKVFCATCQEQIRWVGVHLDDFLCEQFDRVVGRDNCVSFEGMKLQIPPDRHRCHYIKAAIKVHRYLEDTLAVFHGPRKLANYDASGILINEKVKAIA
jgi:hypothetical protein